MKKGLLLGLGVLITLVSGQSQAASSLNVKVSQADNKVQISFTTKAHNSSMCYLSNNRVELQKKNSFGRRDEVEGRIEVSAAVSPTTMCMMAFGPHRGSISFDRGRQFPQLDNGKYELILNGENYGTLVVAADSVNLIE